jgi:hypothetical protein
MSDDSFNQKHLTGGWAEAVCTAKLMKAGYLVFNNVMSTGPIDLICVNPRYGIYLIDVKAESKRPNKLTDQTYSQNKYRIHRPLKPLQKLMRVRVAYISKDGEIHIVPPIPGLADATTNKEHPNGVQIIKQEHE